MLECILWYDMIIQWYHSMIHYDIVISSLNCDCPWAGTKKFKCLPEVVHKQKTSKTRVGVSTSGCPLVYALGPPGNMHGHCKHEVTAPYRWIMTQRVWVMETPLLGSHGRWDPVRPPGHQLFLQLPTVREVWAPPGTCGRLEVAEVRSCPWDGR